LQYLSCCHSVIFQRKKGGFVWILCRKWASRPKYLLIAKLRENITLSGRRWKPHGSSKEGGGKEAGSKEARKEGSGKEEIIFLRTTLNFFMAGRCPADSSTD
jgi:hypothetical protein